MMVEIYGGLWLRPLPQASRPTTCDYESGFFALIIDVYDKALLATGDTNVIYRQAALRRDVAHDGNHRKKPNAYLTIYINSCDMILKIY